MLKSGIGVFLLMIASWLPAMAGDPFKLAVQREYSPNLIKNSGFEELDTAGMPTEWGFDNCSRSKYIRPEVVSPGAGGRHAAKIGLADRDNPELYGYWVQTVRNMQEGRKYYLALKVWNKNINFTYWIQNDGGKTPMTLIVPFFSPPGDIGTEVLPKFIDSNWVRGFRKNAWNAVEGEFEVPEKSEITAIALRLGCYASTQGEVVIDDVYLGLAANRVKVKITGSGLKEIAVYTETGARVLTQELNPNVVTQNWNFELPSRYTGYCFRIEDVKGHSYQRKLE